MVTALLDSPWSVQSVYEGEKSEECTDEAIVHAFYGGHVEWAVEQVYMRYKQYMYGLAYRILQDSYLAEDVIQEVFFTLWQKTFSYQKELGTLKSWLQVIVRNRALDKVRSSIYREHKFAQLQDMNGLDLASHEPEMWQRVWGEEQKESLRKALSELPSEQRHVLELNYFAGYSHGEIASQLQIPVGTVKGRIRLGLLKVKQRLQADGIADEV